MSVKEAVLNSVKKRKKLNERLKKMIIERLNLDLELVEIEDDAGLFGMGLGLDSIDALDLAVGVAEEFDVTIEDDQMEVFRSVNTLADFIEQQTEGSTDND